jgi:hypothetical protein
LGLAIALIDSINDPLAIAPKYLSYRLVQNWVGFMTCITSTLNSILDGLVGVWDGFTKVQLPVYKHVTCFRF